ncbi:ribose-phosphate diphosphokinase [Aureivirga sp. CE67]|uniref:ribose-phosphate diphosphokinase n=1 Tax=Aureivirga sp. CE67 TaxID=1788983 RepID=UPI0018CB7AB8|nr:ribose-phosphate diphosphokinase [Aureivirga sp. CE67]
MNYLHLDSEFTPFQKGIDYKYFTFSGGEPSILIAKDFDKTLPVTITCRIREFNSIGKLLLAVDALRRLGVVEIHLLIPYFPGARQDRIMQKGEAFTAKVYADLINNLHLKSVSVFDVHSEITPTLLHNCNSISNINFVKKCLENFEEDYCLVAPDLGASKKIYSVAKELENENVIFCHKNRDIRTGRITHTEVFKEDLEQKTCVIIDDICDKGTTFIEVAKVLKRKNAGKLILIISHGIFSAGFEVLFEYYDEIFTTDSFRTFPEIENLHQIDFELAL